MQQFKDFTNWFDGVIWTPYLFLLLLGCGLLFSIVTKFIQWRALTHGVQVVRGKYDREEDAGQISHFQALCAALSATIGLGNIAGVGVAVTLGGPGAIFWMWIVGLFGMAIKFVECSLATMFRDEQDVPDPSSPAGMEHDAETHALEYAGEAPAAKKSAKPMARGEVRGGPMWYIQKALVEPFKARGNPLWVLFRAMAILYALVIAVASFGGGNMYQSWNVGNTLESEGIAPIYSGAVIAVLVSLVIIGGIKRIGRVAEKLVPGMCLVYVAGSLVVILMNADQIGHMLSMIVTSAFSRTAGEGAFAGVGIQMAFTLGLKRALFSNEAGQGSAAIAHAAAKTDEPIREGVVAAMGPFIDTIIICTMTALVVLSAGVWNRPPVGTVASITDQTITVKMTQPAELPERLREAHYAELANEHSELWVLVERVEGDEPKYVTCKSTAFAGKHYGAAMGAHTFDMTPDANVMATDPTGFDERWSKLEVGQPVHLGLEGAQITRFAMDAAVPGMGRWIILIGVCLFAFSTMISWSYYGEKGTEFLFGRAAILPYKIIFVIAVYAGCMFEQFKPVYNFSDAMTGLTVFCNLPACLILLPTLIRAARDYFRRLSSGSMKPVR